MNENYDLKDKIFNKLTECTEKGTTLASNTSSISITRLAGGLQDQSRAQDVIGMHFMNPVPVMKLVEVIKGLQTSEDTV